MSFRTTVIIALSPCLSFAQPGTLDPTFSGDGIHLVEVSAYDDEVHGLTILPDGRIVGVGWVDDGSFVYAVAQRLLVNGSPDPSFGSVGPVLFPVSGQAPYAYSVGQQSGDRLIMSGLIYDASSDGNAFVIRLLPDGYADTSFGNNGMLSLDYGQGFGFQSAWAMEVMPDDRIVLVGEAGEAGIVCVRLTAEGAYDSDFGNNGVATTGVPFGSGLCVHVYPDGSVLAGGYRLDGGSDLLLARFDANGQLDPAFGTAGITTIDLGGSDTEFMRGLDVLPDGRIAICGSRSFNGADDEPVVAMLLADGTLDAGFNNNGILILPFTAPQWGQARSIIAQPDGKLLVSGFRAQPGGMENNDLFLYRLLDDGTFDPAFAGNGQVFTDVSGSLDRAFAMALAPDGAIVLAGYGTVSGRTSAFARYINDITTTMEVHEQAGELLVWPNPATNEIKIQIPAWTGSATLKMIATDGREVLRSPIPDRDGSRIAVIELPADLAAGTYRVQVESEGTSFISAVVIGR